MLVIHSCKTGVYDMNFTIESNKFPSLPSFDSLEVQPGLAGAVCGLISDELVVAGGSNFPDSLPWLGGTKTYYDDVYCYRLNGSDSSWKVSELKLPEPLAYSACISMNNLIYSIGGENSEGLSSKVFSISKKDDGFVLSEQTALPKPVSNAGIAFVGNTIYLVGGSGLDGAVSDFYSANEQDTVFSWERLPDLPQALSSPVVVSQWDGKEACIYVLGGRNKTGRLSTFYSAIWKYSPSSKEWNKVGDIKSDAGEPVTLAAGCGAAFDKHYIFLFGGDNGVLYNKTEDFIYRIAEESDAEVKRTLNEEKIAHLTDHPGFCRDIIVFNTLTNQCATVGETPSAAQVTTSVVRNGNRYFIPNGEIRPGVRTPEVTQLIITKQ
ncbi:MAG: hypothetical protein CR996_01055 [Draconibacterium sp.]|nr:MAG: hypothetical protein CR996_01055 [Draconibacterium sp.]